MRSKITNPATIAALVCAWLLLGAPAHAATVRLAPEPGLTNIPALNAVNHLGNEVPYQQAEILGSSSIVVNFDPGSRSVRFDAVSLDLGLTIWLSGLRGGHCVRSVTFRLAEGSVPLATVDAVGHFRTSVTVVMTYETSPGLPSCFAFSPGSLTAIWDVAGTITLDAGSGRTRLTDVTVDVRTPSGNASVLSRGTLTLNFWDGFGVTETPKFQRVGDTIKLVGSDITPGSVLKVYVNSPRGVIDVLPDGLAPTATTPTTWEGVLPWPWPVPAPDDFQLGYGFMIAVLIRTDRGFDHSNGIARVLLGNNALGVPGIERVSVPFGSVGLAPSSWSPSVAAANMETALVPGQSYFFGGTFAGQDPVVNIFSAAGDCAPDGGVVPTSRGSDFIGFTIPATCPTGPGAFQVVDRRTYHVSNIVYIPLGALIRVDDVTVLGRTVHVTGAGFSRFTTLNLFATQRGTGDVLNFGGNLPSDEPRITLTSVTPTSLTFQLPQDVAAGPAFVSALNPPFIPFNNSHSRSTAGDFTIP